MAKGVDLKRFIERSNKEEADELMAKALKSGRPVSALLAEMVSEESAENIAAIKAIIEQKVRGLLTFPDGYLADLASKKSEKEQAEFVSEDAIITVLAVVGRAFDDTPKSLRDGLEGRQIALTLREKLPMVRSILKLIGDGHEFFTLAAPGGFKIVTSNEETPKSTRDMVLTQQAVINYEKSRIEAKAVMVEVVNLGGKLISTLDYQSMRALRSLDVDGSSWLRPDDKELLDYGVGKRSSYSKENGRGGIGIECESYMAPDLGWRIELFVPFKK